MDDDRARSDIVTREATEQIALLHPIERLEQRARRHEISEETLARELVQRRGDRAELVGELSE